MSHSTATVVAISEKSYQPLNQAAAESRGCNCFEALIFLPYIDVEHLAKVLSFAVSSSKGLKERHIYVWVVFFSPHVSWSSSAPPHHQSPPSIKAE